MSKNTKIEWCDSTVNLQMGCTGCELWNPKTGVTACYAGQLTRRWAGKPGWPSEFEKQAIFMERLAPALRWPDLTGTDRPAKPWLNGLPRLIFLNDMGDTFTEGLPLDWLAPAIEPMAETPHRWIILTKRPRRMVQFFGDYGRIPSNFWLMTSATDQATWDGRVPELIKAREINPRITLGVSIEPLLGAIDMHVDSWGGPGMIGCRECGNYSWPNVDATECPHCGQMSDAWYERLNWIIVGGESGPEARPMHPDWVRTIRDGCVTEAHFFFKSWGEWRPNPEIITRVGKSAAGRLLDGREWNNMPILPEVAF